MPRSSKSTSTSSVNRKSDGRTTVKSLTVILVNGEFQQSIRGDVKGTSPGNLYATLRKSLNDQGKSIKQELPDDIASGFVEDAGAVQFKHVLLLSWKQCPTCGSTSDNPTKACPDCQQELKFDAQDAKDFKESSK